jgi:uncharacterized membrane protein
LAALCYIGFTFFKIDIPVGPEKTAFHFGNVFCVLAALLIGGYWGGLAGAVGMTLADLTTSYVTSAPKTNATTARQIASHIVSPLNKARISLMHFMTSLFLFSFS